MREIQQVRDGMVGADDLMQKGGPELEIVSANAEGGGEGVLLCDGQPAHYVRRSEHHSLVQHYASHFGEDRVDSSHDVDESVAGEHSICTLRVLFIPMSCAAGRNSLENGFKACAEPGGATSPIQLEQLGVTIA